MLLWRRLTNSYYALNKCNANQYLQSQLYGDSRNLTQMILKLSTVLHDLAVFKQALDD